MAMVQVCPILPTPTNPALPVNPASPANMHDLALQCVLSLASPHTRRIYFTAITNFIRSGHRLDRSGVLAWVNGLINAGQGASSVNQQLAAVRKLVWEASIRGLISNDDLNAIDRIKGVPIKGTRAGNWTSIDGIKALLQAADDGPNATRNKAIIAILAGCGLRRAELCSLDWSQWQQRDGRWCLVDIKGKGNRVRTVPVPNWVADYINQWLGEQQQ